MHRPRLLIYLSPVVVISLGSQSALTCLGSAAAINLILGALKYDAHVLFTGERPDINLWELGIPEHALFCTAFIPQWRVLNHKNVKVFITHCGANSTHEGLYAGVAMIPLPFFYDQYYIAQNLEELYGYNKVEDYSPLRKSDLQPPNNCTNDELVTYFHYKRGKVCNAIKLAFNIPPDKLGELRRRVEEENGVSCFADVIESLAKV